ncbi:unnamed protein product, partial [Bubo scandiacus]
MPLLLPLLLPLLVPPALPGAVEVTRPRGVSLSVNHHFYEASKPFTCLDGSATIAFAWVNDDYCDCRDGSDEPGTAACPQRPLPLHQRRVPAPEHPLGPCQRRRLRLLRRHRRVRQRRCLREHLQVRRGGERTAGNWAGTGGNWARQGGGVCVAGCHAGARRELGRREREALQRRAEVARGGRPHQRAAGAGGGCWAPGETGPPGGAAGGPAGAGAARGDPAGGQGGGGGARAGGQGGASAPLGGYGPPQPTAAPPDPGGGLGGVSQPSGPPPEPACPSRAAGGGGGSGRGCAGGRAPRTPLTPRPLPRVTAGELRARPELDTDGDGTVSEDEAQVGPPEPPQTPPTGPGGTQVSRKVTPLPPPPTPAMSSPQTRRYWGTWRRCPPPQHLEEKGPEEHPPAPPFDAATQALIDAAQQAREELEEAERALKEAEESIRALEQELAFDFGPQGEFSYLYSQCYELGTSEYIYRLCPFKRVSQKPKHGGAETNLGTWGAWAGPEHDRFSAMKYEHGTGCWQGPQPGHHGEAVLRDGDSGDGHHGAQSLRVPDGAGDARGVSHAPLARGPRRAL